MGRSDFRMLLDFMWCMATYEFLKWNVKELLKAIRGEQKL